MATYYQTLKKSKRTATLSYCMRAFCALLLLSPHCGHTASTYSVAPVGASKLGHLGFQLKWQAKSSLGKGDYLIGYWDAIPVRGLLATPHALLSAPSQTPTKAALLRYQRQDGTGFYAEAGASPRYVFNDYAITDSMQSSRLALNAIAGIGFIWKNGLDLGFKTVHSTGNQGRTNNEVNNLIGIDLQYRW